MEAIFHQLGVDSTYFIQLGLFLIVFGIVGKLFFKPYLQLFEARHKQTVLDREAAEKMLAQAEAKLQQYRNELAEARRDARKNYDDIVLEAKKRETELITEARAEVKKLLQEASSKVSSEKESIRKSLEKEVDQLAKSVSERLLAK